MPRLKARGMEIYMKKRMLAGMMAFIMAGMLTACGSSSSVSESAKSGEDKENKTNTGSAEDGNRDISSRSRIYGIWVPSSLPTACRSCQTGI